MMSLEFSFKDFVDVMIPPEKRMFLMRMLLIGCAIGVAAFLISYTVVYGG